MPCHEPLRPPASPTDLSVPPIAVAALAGAFALAACAYGIADKPLWLDEITTFHRANLPLPALLENSLHNKHLPTYFLLERLVDGPVIREGLLRWPSALAAAATAALLALIAAELRGALAGAATGVLAALAPIGIQFGQEARPYALATALITVALWGLLRILRDGDADRARRGWGVYTAASIAAVNVLTVAWVFVAVSTLLLAIAWRRRPAFARRWLVSLVLLALFAAPGLFGLYHFMGSTVFEGHRWVPAATTAHVGAVLGATYFFRFANLTTFALMPVPFPFVGALVAALALFGAHALGRRPERLALVLAAAAMPAALFAISLAHPLWVPRYLTWSVGPFLVLAGIGLAALPRPAMALGAVTIVAAAGANAAAYYVAQPKPRWDLTAQYLSATLRPRDLVVVNDKAAHYVLTAYAPKYGLDAARIMVGEQFAARSAAGDFGDLWTIYGRTGHGDIPSETAYLDALALRGAPGLRIAFGADILGARFDHASVQMAGRAEPKPPSPPAPQLR